MARENRILPDSAGLWNGGEGFTFPLLHSEAAYSGISDSSPSSFLQLQVSPFPMGFYHGDPENYVGHASKDSFSSMTSNVTQANQLLMSSALDPLFPGDVFPAETNHAMSFSSLNGMQSYDLNSNVQLHEAPPVFGSNPQLDINMNPVNIGGELGSVRYGPHDWVVPGEPQLGSSKLDGSFLSLGHNGSVGSRIQSYTSAEDCNVSRLSLPPFSQETCHGPFNPIDDGACGSLRSPNVVPSGNEGYLTLSHDAYGILPDLSSGFDVSTSLPSSRQHIEVNQLMPAANGRSPVMGNDMITRYTHPGSKAYQTIPSGLFSNSQFRSSESGHSWMSSFPPEVVTTRSRQQSIAEENKGIGFRSNFVSPFQSPTGFPTLGNYSRKDQPGQPCPVIRASSVGHGETVNLSNKPGLQEIYHVPHERSIHVPGSESYPLNIVTDQAVSANIRDGNVEYKRSLKRGPSPVTSVTPRKIMRQHTVGPPRVHVQPVLPQRSVTRITSVNPSISPMSANISQPPLHPTLQSSVQTAHLQYTPGNIVPAFTPFANNHSSIHALPKTIPAPQQSSIANSTSAYPSSLSTCTNNTIQPQLHPSLMAQAQTAHLQKFYASMPQPIYRTSAMSPMQTAKRPNPLEMRPPDFAASSNVSCSATNLLNAMPQPSITSLPGPLQNPLPRAAIVKTLPVYGATRNPPIFNQIAQRSLAISAQNTPTVPVASERNPASAKELPGLSEKAASTARNRLKLMQSSAVRRLVESQFHALAAFEKKSPALDPSVRSSSTPHIRWKAPDSPEASGFKCPLCKRDLAYTPEGPVSIPAILPEVAVLHCGHTFHDHCLNAITPQDQATNPPCIPCSIGELCD